jgi:acyl-CoA synthetase (AMP-forming)/AMP-acid ligase II
MLYDFRMDCHEISPPDRFSFPLSQQKWADYIHGIRIITSTTMNCPGIFTIRDVLFEGNQDPGHNAIESPGYAPLSYRELRDQIAYVVKTLNAKGFNRNDRIAVITPGGPETAVLMISVMAGFTCVSINPRYKHDEYNRYFSRLRINAIIIQKGDDTPARSVAIERNLPVIEMVAQGKTCGKFTLLPETPAGGKPRFAAPEDIALIVLTSGSTDIPKIVPLTQRLICTAAKRGSAANQYTGAERCLLITQYYHMIANSSMMQVMFVGGTVICTRDFIAPDIVPLLKDYCPTFYSAPPALHRMILRELKKAATGKHITHSLRFIRTISAFMPAELRSQLEEVLGVPVMETYGMSEVGMAIASTFSPRKTGFVGKPNVEQLAIMDDEGVILDSPEPGEIVVRGASVFDGYENAPEENAAAFTAGWFRTGDIGYLDKEGFLWISGRKKELINKGGEKIAPAEVDAVLMAHPLVKDAMSFKIPDPVFGEDIAAMVVPAEGPVAEQELRMYLLNNLAQFKVPRRIYFVNAIPRNLTGKPLRHVGTERYSGSSSRYPS